MLIYKRINHHHHHHQYQASHVFREEDVAVDEGDGKGGKQPVVLTYKLGRAPPPSPSSMSSTSSTAVHPPVPPLQASDILRELDPLVRQQLANDFPSTTAVL